MHSTKCLKPVVLVLALWLMAGAALADKLTPSVQMLPKRAPVAISPRDTGPMLRTGDTCTVNLAGDPYWYIYPWVVGDELYKVYQDPSVTCDKPYPFTVDVVYLPLVYLDTGMIYISVDVEDVDLSNPTCPMPGNILRISPLYEISLENNFYLISFPLDTPVAVNGPYFVGVYIADMGNPTAAAVVTDTIPAPCVAYNDWGEGYVDVDTVHAETGEKIFPGRLIIYSGGITGGSGGTQPVPAARFITPAYDQFVGSPIDLWADDAAGSEIIAQVQFQYQNNQSWYDIGFDNSNARPLRNGVAPSGSGNGLSYGWSPVGLAEKTYQLRTVITDTLGRADTAEVPVKIDPTPPLPLIVRPVLGQNVCGNVAVQLTCPDEDLVFMSFDTRSIPIDFTVAIPIVNQNLGGDVNGNPNDGNLLSNGEFGDYCSGPAAAAMAAKYWFSKGYNYILMEGGAEILTDVQLMNRLESAMVVRDNQGTYDEEFVAGLRAYIMTHGDQFDLKITRSPSAHDLYNWIGDYEYTVMAGLAGNPGFWMTQVGMIDMGGANGQYTLKMADPLTGSMGVFTVKEESGGLWLLYNSVWHKIDILVGMFPKDWTVTRRAIGVDVSGSDGWGFTWDTGPMAEDSLYFMHATAFDNSGNKGDASVLVLVDCSVNGQPGDLNNDGTINAADIVYLTNFLYMNGVPPVAGYGVADVNCDSAIDLSDLIFLFNHVFNAGPAPCP